MTGYIEVMKQKRESFYLYSGADSMIVDQFTFEIMRCIKK